MKHYQLFAILAVISLFIISCGGSNKSVENADTKAKENDLLAEKLSGDVQSVRQRVYWALDKFGRIEKGKLQNMKAHDFLKAYDKDGFLTEETYFDVNDVEQTRRVISYNDDNQRIKEEFYTVGKLTSVTNYSYEKNLLTEKEILDESGKLKERSSYIYYDNDLLMDEDRYGANEQLTQKIVHLYDSENLLVEKQYYWGGGTPYKRERFFYDSRGNVASIYNDKYDKKEPIFDGNIEFLDYNAFRNYLTKNVYDKNEEMFEINDYVYDQCGNLTYRSLKKLNKRTIEYEEVIETADFSYGEEDDYIAENNDYASENIVRETITEWVFNSGEAYEYAYDEQNNWTRKITYKIDDKENKTRQFYYERIIEYR